MSGRGGKALTVMAAVAISWYTGVKFWQPLVIEQLKKDGNLRDDIYVNDKDDLPKSWQDVKDRWKDVVHPENVAPETLGQNATILTVDSIKVESVPENPSPKE
ncbi:CIC11C00000003448 [Sungouiella intermedia]|uniref:CIC11C00000003448 n=1 Tax=Sungouiella intermedia TaxID=45354 RepID=A0A1L0DPV2_9ASCO|nr:CIC11C00000003448 [[Candida] intermedia]